MLKRVREYFSVTDESGRRKIDLSHGDLYFVVLYLLAFCYASIDLHSLGLDDALFLIIRIVLLFLSGLFFTAMFFVLVKQKDLRFNPIVVSILLGVSNLLICEAVNKNSPVKTYLPYTIIGIMLYAVLFLIGAVVSRITKVWFCFVSVLCTVFAIVQSQVMAIRGTPLRLNDFMNIRSALAIKDEYTFSLSLDLIVCIILTVINLAVVIILKYKENMLHIRLIYTGALVIGVVFLMLTQSFWYSPQNGIKRASPYTLPETLGSLNTLFYDAMNSKITKPDDYSDQGVIEGLNKYKAEKKDVGTPIIIGILSESLADYSHVSSFDTSVEPLSVWKSLKENTVKGYTSVSSYGGGTCNSEYEVLTGNSMMFLSDGATPYTMYMPDHRNSIVDTFNGYGFDTVGISPIDKETWDIENVYKRLGFDHTYFLNGSENRIDSSLVYDDELFKYICSLADTRDRSRGQFIWAATMQNHSPFGHAKSNELLLKSPYNREAEIYLNGIHESDKALAELIKHFKDYDEKVIIFLFGDHFPFIPGFENQLLSNRSDVSGLEKVALTHQTPFFIWCNQKITEKEIDDISLNYLSNEVFEVAGIPLEPYQQELAHIRDYLPITTEWGYMDADRKWHEKDEVSEKYKGVIDEYAALCYYRLFRED